jgi:hypothetical protein
VAAMKGAGRMAVWLMTASALMVPATTQVPPPHPPAFSHSRWLVDRAVGLADVQHTDAGDVVMWRGGGQLSYRVGDVLSTEHRAITLPICAGPNTGGSITLGDVLDSGKALLIGKSFHT